MFYNIIFMYIFLVCMFRLLFCVFCVFVLFCVLFPVLYIAVPLPPSGNQIAVNKYRAR
jgi:hypothetical protein